MKWIAGLGEFWEKIVDFVSTIEANDPQVIIASVALSCFSAWFAYRAVAIAQRSRREETFERQSIFRPQSIQKLDPRAFVGSFDHIVTTYLPITKDDEIARCFRQNVDILIVGRGGLGKSHAAFTHIVRHASEDRKAKWKVIAPRSLTLRNTQLRKLPRSNYVLLLDDLHEYIIASGAHEVFDAISALKERARNCIVVATLRSTSPEMDAISGASRVFSRFRVVALEDWTDAQRDNLIQKTGVDPRHWNGTPLSGKNPSPEMQGKFLALPDCQRLSLIAAKTAASIGIRRCPIQLIGAMVTPIRSDFSPSDVEKVKRLGFAKSSEHLLEVYEPYLEFLPDHSPLRETLRQTLLSNEQFSGEAFQSARTLQQRGEYQAAKDLLEVFVKFKPDVEAGHYRLGLVHARLRDWPKTVSCLQRAIAIRPNFTSALYQLANAYQRMGAEGLAQSARLQAHATVSSVAPARLMAHAEVLIELNELDEAIKLLQSALTHDSKVAFGWGLLGQALLRQRKLDDAEKAFLEAEKLGPDSFVLFGLGQIARARGDWAAAASWFLKSVESYPYSSQARSLLAQALQKLDRNEDAIAEFQIAIALGGRNCFGLGQAYLKTKQYALAVDNFLLATKDDPSMAVAYSYLGTALERAKRREEALVAHRTATEIEPSSEHHWFGYADCLLRADRKAEAERACRKALSVNAAHLPSQRLLERLEKSSS